MSEEKVKSVIPIDYVPFVQLHNHSHYSLLDGLSDPSELVDEAVKLKMKALALTDHGSCAGLLVFQKACRDKGIKPILGIETYVCNNIDEKSDERFHLVLLAKNHVGLQNIMHLSTIGETKGKYYRPRIDFSLLEKNHEGIIVTSACQAGEIAKSLLNRDYVKAEEIALKYKKVFGEDFYLEVMKHKYNDIKKNIQDNEEFLADEIIKLGKKLDIKVIATNDTHYARKSDVKYHDLLLCIQTIDVLKNPNRFSFQSSDFYLKSYSEMKEMFSEEILNNTLEIVNKIEDGDLLHSSKDLLPKFDVPKDFKDEEAYLKAMVKDGMREKGFLDKQEYRDRIKFEMEVIVKCGYTKYFLVLWDIINFAKTMGIRTGAGRGSAVGCLCLYVLGITKLDPVKYDLLFERFLNPDRVSPPDVDMDFDDSRREEIFQYIINKYGPEYCCKIGTYNSLKAKSVIKGCVKALDLGKDWEIHQREKEKHPTVKVEMTKNSLNLADMISKTIPFTPGITVEDAYKSTRDFREAVDNYPGLLDYAIHLEKTLTSAGVHAAGIVVCRDKVDEHLPMRESKGQICSQFTGPEVESLGLLKFDMLGLKNLTIIENTLKMIKDRHGIDIDIDKIDETDKKVLELFNRGETKGIFQFESAGMVKLLQEIHVDSFYDLVAANALYRPGPLGAGVPKIYADTKHSRNKVPPLHPKMADILQKTFSVMVFQEDFMKVARELAGFTRGESDSLRKYVGKKKLEELAKQREKFVNGCIKNDIAKDIANKIFDQIEFFGGYGFNMCLSGDTLVKNKLDNKLYTLKDLSKSNMTIVLDSYVDGKNVEDEIVRVFETGVKEIWEIELNNGMIINGTLDHKFICSDGEKHTVKEIINICKIDRNFGIIGEDMKIFRIISIKYNGIEETYNVTMRSDQHNYKIVTTCGKGVYSANSHSCAYGYIGVQTAYLKTYYPIEYMCNVLSAEIADKDKTGEYIKEVHRMKLVLKGTSINKSGKEYLIEEGRNVNGEKYSFIRCPLTILPSVGEKAVESILANQPFKSINDFLIRTDARQVSSRVFKSLVDSKALLEISEGKKDREIFDEYERTKKEVSSAKVDMKKHKKYTDEFGGGSLFGRIGDGEESVF